MCGTELHFLDGLLAPASAVVPVPEGLGLPTAASLCCSATTALHAVDVAGMRSGDTAVVYGLGGVGLALVQVLRERACGSSGWPAARHGSAWPRKWGGGDDRRVRRRRRHGAA